MKSRSSVPAPEYPLFIRCIAALALIVPFPIVVVAHACGQSVAWHTVTVAGLLSTNAMTIVVGRENAILKTITCCVTRLTTRPEGKTSHKR